MNTLQKQMMERYQWQKEFEERYHNPDRLLHLWNNFFLTHQTELDYHAWYQDFHRKVYERYEELAHEMAMSV